MGNPSYGKGKYDGLEEGTRIGAEEGMKQGTKIGYKNGVRDATAVAAAAAATVATIATVAKKSRRTSGRECPCCGANDWKEYISKKGNRKIKCCNCGEKFKL